MAIKSELLLLRRRASVVDRVIHGSIEDCRESLLTLLASVATVPDVIHVGIQAVVVAAVLVNDVNGLSRAIHAISVLRLKQENAQLWLLAHICVPLWFLGALRHCL